MFTVLLFLVALLLVGVCGGVGVVVQRFFHVVERPLEFAPAIDRARIDPVAEPTPVAPPRPARPAPRVQPVRAGTSVAPVAEPPPEETPVPGPAPLPPVLAAITVSGDAVRVRALGVDGDTDLPASLAAGTYRIEVQFAEGTPFVATTLLVLDSTARDVDCRASRGICKVRP